MTNILVANHGIANRLYYRFGRANNYCVYCTPDDSARYPIVCDII